MRGRIEAILNSVQGAARPLPWKIWCQDMHYTLEPGGSPHLQDIWKMKIPLCFTLNVERWLDEMIHHHMFKEPVWVGVSAAIQCLMQRRQPMRNWA